MYPDYVYRPQRSKGRGKKSGKGKATDYDDQSYTDSESAPFVLSAPPVFLRGHSRSSSAPTPAAGQYGIQLPTVYMPSCPSSPAMMPIQQTRRKSRPSHLHESMTQFDFLDEDLIPPFGDSNEYQGSLSINEGFNFGMPSGAPEYRDRDGGFRSLSINTNFDNRHSLYPQHHISPAGTNMHSSCSTSSGRSSPYRSPYTPQTMPGTLPEQDLQGQLRDMEIQYGNEQAAAWREQEEMLWPQDIVDVQGCNDEFDPLSGGIPALTLGLPAFEEDEYEFIQAAAASSSLYEARPFSEDREMQLPPQDFERDTFSSMFAFDDMDMMDPSASQDSDRF
ncbi:hypothetical protein JAAARDRAFT_533857 [Jaapia argillacea MUCL 33604]|uniref:Uncharacterized protein n=1 Tax=Jaapia argillacea MUCL 33604 TaxID=933084 RepID=A0A067PK48_9AGAM|nr:hypothetical protein JAAARDRAFT_533857 [Jaapia argillacea MUCL 33604]